MSQQARNSATESRFEVGVVVMRRRLKGPWASYAWLPAAALPAVPATAPWTLLARSEDEETYYAGAFAVELHRSDTAHYRDNLHSGEPSLWVSLRPAGDDGVEVGTVTADPYEGEALAEGVGEIVEPVPMPPELQEQLAAFVEAFHVERQFFKRKRDRADPEGRARRGPGGNGRGPGVPRRPDDISSGTAPPPADVAAPRRAEDPE